MRTYRAEGGYGSTVLLGIMMVSKELQKLKANALALLALISALVALNLACVITAQAESAVASSAETKANLFNIFEYRIDGNTVLPSDAVERAVYPFLGEEQSVKSVEGARAALEKTYHDLGYLSVMVETPEQKVNEGIVTLRVIEAPIGRLSIKGSRYFSLGYIRSAVPSLAEGKIPRFDQVQLELAGVNTSADRRVSPVLKPSATPGKVDVELKVQDQLPLHGNIELNNRHGANTTATRLAAQVHYDNLWQLGHSISLRYEIAPERPSDSKVAVLSYVIPAASGPTYAFYAVDSRSNVAAVGTSHVIGNGKILGARLIEPLPVNKGSFFHTFTAGVDYKDFEQNVNLDGSTSVETPITYLPFTLQYSLTLPKSALELSGNFLFRGMVTDASEFASKRSGADTSYFVLRGMAKTNYDLGQKWNAMLKAEGQLADGPLISNEQFSAGGAESVRGYNEAEVAGDDGFRGTLEIQSPPWFVEPDGWLKEFQALAFAEGALFWVREALPGQNSRMNIGSAGLGLRMTAWGHYKLDLDAAHVIRNGQDTKAGDNLVSFRMNYEF